MNILSACMPLYPVLAMTIETRFGFSKTRVTDGRESPCWCWESNLDHTRRATSAFNSWALLDPQKVKILSQPMRISSRVTLPGMWAFWNMTMNRRLYGLIGTITTHVYLCNPFWYFPFCLTVGFLLLSSDFLLDFYTILSLKTSVRPIGHAGSWCRTWALKKTWGWVAQDKLWFHSMFEASSGYMRSCLKNQGFALLWFVFPTTSYNFVTWTKIKLSSRFSLTA